MIPESEEEAVGRLSNAISKLQHHMQGKTTSKDHTMVSIDMREVDYTTTEIVQAMLEFYEVAETKEEATGSIHTAASAQPKEGDKEARTSHFSHTTLGKDQTYEEQLEQAEDELEKEIQTHQDRAAE